MANRIVQLIIRNFMNIKLVEIRPDGSFIEITGKNGMGKSSIIRALRSTLGGAAYDPPEPVRQGEKKAETAILIDDKYLVKATWKVNGKRELTLHSADGKIPYSSPQTRLDKLFPNVGFDSNAFDNMKPKEKAETLRELLGLDFTEFEQAHDADFAARTELGRQSRALQAQIDDMPDVEAPDLLLVITDLTAELTAAITANATKEQMRIDLDNKNAELERLALQRKAAEDEVARLVAAAGVVNSAQTVLATAYTEATTIDTAPIEQKITEAEATNELIRKRMAKRTKIGEREAIEERRNNLTASLARLEADRKQMIADCDMPVEGLDFSDDGLVTFNGVPFEQCAKNERIRTSTAIGLRLNPFICVEDAAVLDDEHMQMMRDIVDAEDGAIWLEVATNGEDRGTVIEDGKVRAAK